MKKLITKIVYGGEKGYVPFYSDPPNVKVGQIDNLKPVLTCDDSLLTADEAREENHDNYSMIYDPETKNKLGYMEDTHLKLPPNPEPPPIVGKKYHIDFPGGIDITVV
jgi:hypothetical protein